jgi:HD-GYP domain-containing protein (c-di-GMP phosphodiesterase class II)
MGGNIMRFVEINRVKPGMIVAQPIYDLDNGKVLLYDNVVLKKSYINRLKALHYTHVYIKDADDPICNNELPEPIRHETKVKATVVLKNIFDTYYRTKKVELVNLQAAVSEMIDQIIDNKDVFYNLVDIRTYDSYTYAHSVNVCMLSLIVGSMLRLNRIGNFRYWRHTA